MRDTKLLQKEHAWRRRTGHAYAENLEKIPKSESARKHWLHKPYGGVYEKTDTADDADNGNACTG